MKKIMISTLLLMSSMAYPAVDMVLNFTHINSNNNAPITKNVTLDSTTANQSSMVAFDPFSFELTLVSQDEKATTMRVVVMEKKEGNNTVIANDEIVIPFEMSGVLSLGTTAGDNYVVTLIATPKSLA